MKKHKTISVLPIAVLFASVAFITNTQAVALEDNSRDPAYSPENRAEKRAENMEANKDYRNVKMAEQREPSMVKTMMAPAWSKASTSPWAPRAVGSTTRPNPFTSSTTALQERREKMAQMQLEMFARVHANLIQQLNQQHSVLKAMRNKLAERIETASNAGRNMSEARSKLSEADQTMANLELAISKVINYVPPQIASSTVVLSEKAPIKVEKAREIGKEAIEISKEVRKALSEVVRAIAKNMGLREAKSATSTPATTTNP